MNHINSYPSVYALGHRAIADIFNNEVLCEEKIDGCVTPETPILCADMSYRPAGSLVVGDRLVGVEYESSRWRLSPCEVTANAPIRKSCMEIITESRSLCASTDHPLLVRRHASGRGNRKTDWITADDIKAGDQIISVPVWTPDTSWLGGYVAGMFDGEGALVAPKKGHHRTRCLTFYQKAGPEADRMEADLKSLGFQTYRDERIRGPKWQCSVSIVIRGDWPQILRFLGTFRPPRLLRKAEPIWSGAATNFCPSERVVSVSKIGLQTVSGLSTSSHTYIANGLVSHNSQFSFGRIGGELRVRSKGKDIIVSAPEKMFLKAVEVAATLPLADGWIYRAEYLQSPKHNTLAYSRVPTGHVMIFDIQIGPETYLSPEQKAEEAKRIGLECVPVLYRGEVKTFEQFAEFLQRESVLGGCKIEGVVVKNYSVFTPEKKIAVGKYVSEEFKEKHGIEWKKSNPTQSDVVTLLIKEYKTEARWRKAVQHLREAGTLEGSPRDIGALMKEVPDDVLKECGDEIRERLFKHFWPNIRRGITAGIPEFWKAELAKSSFVENAGPEDRIELSEATL